MCCRCREVCNAGATWHDELGGCIRTTAAADHLPQLICPGTSGDSYSSENGVVIMGKINRYSPEVRD